MTRRGFACAAALSAVGACAALAGCGGPGGGKGQDDPEQGVDFDLEAAYLPLGSVVLIDRYEDAGIKLVVTARRPTASMVRAPGADAASPTDGRVYDYAGAYWPAGYVTDLSEHAYLGESYVFDSDQIAKVLHVGYSDELESRANEALMAAKESGQASASCLGELMADALGDGVKAAKGDVDAG
ncbi:DUF4176 domain-containing protein [Senegalimassilia anaerobia]|uniref:DUF4176 domain-containing protein n=1 Tax=Senegalimassilia anaerobia TaxID=1473216 RepID=UPI001389414A|nr:DUF4176 domain-containing protein [Senegalimassilia anaerobia]